MSRGRVAVASVMVALLVFAAAVPPRPVSAQAPVTISSSSPDVVSLGATSDAAATAGSTGTAQAKLRFLTQRTDDLYTLWSALISSSRLKVDIDAVDGQDPIATKCEDWTKRTSGTLSTNTSGNTQLVSLTSMQTIYLCDFDLIVADDVVVQVIYGTGSACATGETDLATYRFTADGTFSTGIVRPGGGQVQMQTAASNALCLELSGAVQTDFNYVYVKE